MFLDHSRKENAQNRSPTDHTSATVPGLLFCSCQREPSAKSAELPRTAFFDRPQARSNATVAGKHCLTSLPAHKPKKVKIKHATIPGRFSPKKHNRDQARDDSHRFSCISHRMRNMSSRPNTKSFQDSQQMPKAQATRPGFSTTDQIGT